MKDTTSTTAPRKDDAIDRRLPDEPGPLWQRLAWLVAIWLASICVLGIVAMVIRWWLAP